MAMRTLIRNVIVPLFVAAAAVACANVAPAAPVEPLWSLAQKERAPMLDTMRDLVNIESGSTDLEGLARIAKLIADRLAALGGQVELVGATADERVDGAPERYGQMVQATFTGTGTKKILLLAHMDTVYPRGSLAQQPFRIDGDRAWGLGIADDKHGVALILHTIALLQAAGARDYGTLTVLINGDEEIGSIASRQRITRLGAEHDAVLSFEGGGYDSDNLRLATSGIATAILTVKGRASHAGVSPERGVNALYELAHQVLQMRDLSDPKNGIKVNWTIARAGVVRNMIPPGATAEADIRVERVADLEGVERALRERIRNRLLPDSQVELAFRRGRVPLHATDASRALAEHGRTIYTEIDRKLNVVSSAAGGGTDAAYAALRTRAPVIEGMGLRGFGSHSSDSEFVLVSSIEPRLYLAARLILDIARGRAPLN
jgi:glutamate carboxypeptidase